MLVCRSTLYRNLASAVRVIHLNIQESLDLCVGERTNELAQTNDDLRWPRDCAKSLLVGIFSRSQFKMEQIHWTNIDMVRATFDRRITMPNSVRQQPPTGRQPNAPYVPGGESEVDSDKGIPPSNSNRLFTGGEAEERQYARQDKNESDRSSLSPLAWVIGLFILAAVAYYLFAAPGTYAPTTSTTPSAQTQTPPAATSGDTNTPVAPSANTGDSNSATPAPKVK